jgi:hypothetical protein
VNITRGKIKKKSGLQSKAKQRTGKFPQMTNEEEGYQQGQNLKVSKAGLTVSYCKYG